MTFPEALHHVADQAPVKYRNVGWEHQATGQLRIAANEIEHLRLALWQYGDRQRMSNAADPATQQVIDRAMAEVTKR